MYRIHLLANSCDTDNNSRNKGLLPQNRLPIKTRSLCSQITDIINLVSKENRQRHYNNPLHQWYCSYDDMFSVDGGGASQRDPWPGSGSADGPTGMRPQTGVCSGDETE